jgi:hypothetical protein
MRPDEQHNGQGGRNSTSNAAQKEAAANIIRSQINALFGDNNPEPQPKQVATPEPKPQPVTNQPPHRPDEDHLERDESDPYDRTYFTDGSLDPQLDQWKQYHSAWQNYYQKYYEGYYTYQMKNSAQAEQQPDPSSVATISANKFFGSNTEEY